MSIQMSEDNVAYIDQGDGYHIRLEIADVTDEFYIEKARRELNETPENTEVALKVLRELLLAEEGFTFPLHEDLLLLAFLRPCKFDPKKTFKKMKKYYKFKIKHKKACENITVESVRHVFEENIIKFMPLRDQHGSRIVYISCGKNWKPAYVTPSQMFRAIQMSLYAAMAEPMTQVNGVIAILNVDGFSINQIMHFTPMFAACVLEWIQDCIAVRLKGVFILNNSYASKVVYKIFKPFLGSKLRKRIHFLGNDYEKLVDLVGEKSLPAELGGTLPVPFVDGGLLVDLLKLFDIFISKADYVGYDVAPNSMIDSDVVSSVLKHFNKGSMVEPIMTKKMEIST